MNFRIGLVSGMLMVGIWASAQVPTITGFSPTSGPVGTTVVITGINFSAVSSSNIVYFGAVKAVVSNASTTQLSVVVPPGANQKPISVLNLSNGLLAASAQPFLVTFAGGAPLSTNSLGSSVNFSTGGLPTDVAIADFDGDGLSDVAVANNSSGSVSVFENTSTAGMIELGSFLTKDDFPLGGNQNHIAVGDLDGDGWIDLVSINSGGINTLSVLRNTGSLLSINSSSFNAHVDFVTGNGPQGIAIGDLDGDGKQELIVANSGDNMISVYRNTSSPGIINASSFAARVDFSTSSSPSGIAIADIDLDGKKDLLVACEFSNSISVFRNTSTPGTINSGSLATRIDFATALTPITISVGDLDGDSKVDVVTNNGNSNSVSVLRNTHTTGPLGSGSLANKVDFTTGIFQTNVQVVDMDGDGKLDIVADNTSSNIAVLRNTSTTGVINTLSFAAKIDYSVGTDPFGFDTGDIDGDGKPDLVVASFSTASVSVLHNKVLASEPSAQPPGPITFSHVTSHAFNGSFAEPNPTPTGYLVMMSANSPPNFVPVDGIPYAYNQVVGSVSGNNIYVVQNTSEPGFNLVSLTAGEMIHFKVYSFNGTGPTINYLTSLAPLTGSQAAIADTTPPVVSANSTPSEIAPNTDLVVSASLTDAGSGVDFAELEYRPIAGASPNNFTKVNMVPTTGTTFEFTIPANQVTELGVEYRFLITDFEPNTNSASQTLYKTRIRYGDAFGLKIPYTSRGTAVSNYRIISVPLILDDKSVSAVFGSWLDITDPSIWAMYRYDGTRFAELNGTSQVEMGKGYWILTPVSTDLGTGPGVTADVRPASPFQITLQPGWNQIGNPYNFDISWQDILNANPTQAGVLGATSKIRVFRGTPSDVDELQKFEGGFVRNTSTANVIIDIPTEKNASINGRKAQPEKISHSIDQPNWEIMFSLKQGDAEYNLGGLGMNSDAALDFDQYDDFNLPHFVEYLEVKFPRQRVGMTYTKDIVPTAENFTWEFSVESNIGGEGISMSWDNTHFGTLKKIVLLDVATRRVVNMQEEAKYSFAAGRSRQFKVIFGNEDFVKNELIPDRIVLLDPFPNPFVREVVLEYALPAESVTQPAEIAIYNSQGGRVSAVSLPAVAGAGRWMWGADEIAPGLYFVRLAMGEQVATKKIIKQ